MRWSVQHACFFFDTITLITDASAGGLKAYAAHVYAG